MTSLKDHLQIVHEKRTKGRQHEMTQRPLLRSHDPRADDEGEGAGECLAFYWCEVSSCLVRRIGKRGGGRHAVTCGVKRERARDASDGKG